MAVWGSKMWKKYGALEYFECVADDLSVAKGMGMGFKKLAKLKADETAVFSFIVYKSKAQRDQINKKVMSDPAMKDFDMSAMPFDMKRFATGGFIQLLAKPDSQWRVSSRQAHHANAGNRLFECALSQ